MRTVKYFQAREFTIGMAASAIFLLSWLVVPVLVGWLNKQSTFEIDAATRRANEYAQWDTKAGDNRLKADIEKERNIVELYKEYGRVDESFLFLLGGIGPCDNWLFCNQRSREIILGGPVRLAPTIPLTTC